MGTILKIQDADFSAVKIGTGVDNVDISNLFTTWEPGTVMSTTGYNATSGVVSRTNFVNIEEYAGKTIRFTHMNYFSSSGSTPNWGLCFYSQANIAYFISSVPILRGMSGNGAGAIVIVDVEIPSNAKYVRAVTLNDETTNFKCVVVNTPISDTDITASFPLISESHSISATNGTSASSSYFDATDFVDITQYRGKTLDISFFKYTGTGGSVSGAGLCLYDSNQSKLNSSSSAFAQLYDGTSEEIPIGSTDVNYRLAIPNDAVYLRTCYFKDSTGWVTKPFKISVVNW